MYPVDIRKSGENELTIEWSDGHQSLYSMPMLRKKCPCATCRTARQKSEQASPLRVLSPSEVIDANIQIRDAEIVGRYAIQFGWSDGHREGIYSFDFLLELCECKDCLARKSQRTPPS